MNLLLWWALGGFGCRVSVYVRVVGMGAPRRLKACRWMSVGSASLSMVASVVEKATVLRVRVER
jgi:hypothetical protein